MALPKFGATPESVVKFSIVTVLIFCLLVPRFPAAAQDARDALAIGVPTIPARLDPLTDAAEGPGLLAATCDTLVGLASDGTLGPGLARSWRFDPDARGLTLDLREDATFPDGEPVDAEAVAASLGRMTGEPHSRRRAELAPVVAIETRGRFTLYLKLDRAYAPLAAQLAGRAGMVVQDVAEDNDAPCAGPYRVAARRGDESVELARNDTYFAHDRLAFARVRVAAIADPALRLARVATGALDLAGDVVPADAAEAARAGRLRVSAGTGAGVAAMLFNLSRGPRAVGPFAQTRTARAALAGALDPAALAALSGAGYFKQFAAYPVAPPALGAALELTVPADGENLALAAAIVGQASAAGISIRTRVRDPARASLDVQNGDFESALVRLPARTDPDMVFWPVFHCHGAANDAGFCDAQTDTALDGARAAIDPAHRAAFHARTQARLRTEVPAILLYRRAWLVAAGPRTTGFEASPDGGWRLSAIAR